MSDVGAALVGFKFQFVKSVIDAYLKTKQKYSLKWPNNQLDVNLGTPVFFKLTTEWDEQN